VYCIVREYGSIGWIVVITLMIQHARLSLALLVVLACLLLSSWRSHSLPSLRPHSLSSNSRFSSSSCSIDAFTSINPPRLHAYIIIIITTRTLFHPSPRYASFCPCCCCLAYALHHAAPGNEQGHHEVLDGHWRDILVQVGIPGFECGWWSYMIHSFYLLSLPNLCLLSFPPSFLFFVSLM